MCAQQKRTGWFFNKGVVEKINDVPNEKIEKEAEKKVAQLSEKIVSKQTKEIADLKQVIAEKEQEVQLIQQEAAQKSQQLKNENESYKQVLDRWEEEKVRDFDQIQELEAELDRIQTVELHAEQIKELNRLQTQLEEANVERIRLIELKKQLSAMESEIQETRQKYKDVILQQKNRELQRYNKINQLEKEIADLLNQLDKKDGRINQKEQIIMDQEYKLIQLQRAGKSDLEVAANEEISKLEGILTAKIEENEYLKQELLHAQQETAEVLDSVRKQARKILGIARSESRRIKESSEEEVKRIRDQAQKLAFEVDQSRKDILGFYDELRHRTNQLNEN